MAYLISKQSGNWSSSSTWELISSTNLTFTGVTTLTTSYLASAATILGSITVTGIWLGLYSRSASPSGTLDVQLWNSTTSSQVAIVTINVSDLLTTNVPSAARGVFFRLGAPVTLTAGQSYQIRLRTSVSSQLTFWRSTTNNWCNMIATSTTSSPSASDIMVINGFYSNIGTNTSITVNMDNNNSTTYGGVFIGNLGTLDWLTNVNTQLILNNEVWTGAAISLVVSPGIFRMGSTASRIDDSVTANLIIDAGTNGGRRIQVQDGGSFIAAGSTMSYTWTTLNGDVSVGGTTFSTSVETGWKIGSDIVISPTIRNVNSSTTVQYDRRAISSISNNLISVSPLSYAHSGTGEISADVINLTRNCRISSLNSTLRSYLTVGSTICEVNLSDVEFVNFGSSIATGAVNFNGSGTSGLLFVKNCSFNNCGSGVTLTTSSHFYNCIIDNCVYSTNAATTGSLVYNANAVTTQPISSNSYISNNCMIFGGTSSSTPGISVINNSIDMENNSISGIQAAQSFLYGQTTTYIISGKFNNNKGRFCGNGMTVYFSDTIRTENHPTGNVSLRNLNYGFYLAGSTNSKIQNLISKGNGISNILCSYGVNASTYNLYVNNAVIESDPIYTTGVGIMLALASYPSISNESYVTFNDCTIGVGTPHTTSDIRFNSDSDTFCDLVFNNCYFGSSIEVSQPQFMSRGSKISMQRVNQINGAHRTYYNNGILTLDTTIYRSSGKSVRLTPSNTPPFYQTFGRKIIPVRGNTQPTISVWIRKSESLDGNEYNGTQPRLWIKNNPSIGNFGGYDDMVLATASSSNGIWENLSSTIPIIPYEDTAFEVYIDCSGTIGWVNVDDWKITY